MKEFAGIKLVPTPPFMNYGLIFWCGGELSQSLQFATEEECDTVLMDAIEGKGINVIYSFDEKSVRAYPRRVIKLKLTSEYTIIPNLPIKLRESLTPEVQFPDMGYNLGKNAFQPILQKDINQ